MRRDRSSCVFVTCQQQQLAKYVALQESQLSRLRFMVSGAAAITGVQYASFHVETPHHENLLLLFCVRC